MRFEISWNLVIQKFGITLNPCDKDFRIQTYWNPCVKDFRILDLLELLHQRFPDFQTPPPPAPDEFSDPNLTPLPMHPGTKTFPPKINGLGLARQAWLGWAWAGQAEGTQSRDLGSSPCCTP